jgi:cyclopropane-fatty-acyl-phospholipid synthase
MRRLMRGRLLAERAAGPEGISERQRSLIQGLRQSPIAIETDAANTQHYEVPAAFFHAHLGPRLKYSCCLYQTGRETLAQAEEAMLKLYAERARLGDGQRILDLGCGWGSLSLWLAAKFPGAEIVGLSNSHGQREFIEARATERGLQNLRIVTGNVEEFEFAGTAPSAGFDRVVSIEMFEHMKNYEALLRKVAGWLRPEGLLFVHIFAHRHLAYHFEDQGDDDWMTRHFFSGGTMPSEALLLHFQDALRIRDQWWVDGRHYERTANDWLAGLDHARAECLAILGRTHGPAEAGLWLQRWRMFYMAVAELFGYDQGREWGVAHYLFQRR